MKRHFLTNPASNQVEKVVCLLSLLAILAACTFGQSESTFVSSATKDPTDCLASQGQISLRDCLTAVSQARWVNAYTLGQLR
jgi:ABC-type uncharacterized transport system auxiliary subunit